MKKKAIIIGSGFGGLATAVRLAAIGLDVELFEKLDKLGGRAYPLEINGFHFDGGPSVITAPFLLDDIFREAGRSREDYFQILPVDPFYRVFNSAGQTFDTSGDPENLLSQVENISPGDAAGSQKLMAASQTIYEKGFYKLTHRSFNHLSDMLRITPDLVRLQAYKTVYQHVSHFIKNDFLRQVFSVPPLLIGANPFDATSLYAVCQPLESKHGMYTAVGGTAAIIQGLARLLEELGGKVNLNAEVTEILVEGSKVTGVRVMDGSIRRADLIVSNADVAWTYKYLIPSRRRRTMSDRRIDQYQYSNSLFVIYFGTRRRYLDTRLSHHNILLGPRYQGLMEDIFQRKHLADDFLLYLNVPTLTDPGLAPDGCEGFTVLAPVPHLGSGVDWTKMARPYRDRIMQFLEQNYLPDLQANIIAEHYIDPLYFQNTLNSYHGAAFSFAPTLTQSAWFRPHNRSEEFNNLYFCGAGTHPGPGLPGVLSSARIVEKLIVENAR
jgi:phytoene desaturase